METFYPQSGDWNTVSAAFEAHTVAELALLAREVGIPSEGRKAERIAELCRALEGEALGELFRRLSPRQRAAVAMALHSWDGRLSPEGFRIRYGEEPDFGKASRTWRGLEEPSLLCLFIHGDRIPRDLRFRLRAIVPPPEPWPIPRLDGPPPWVEVRVPAHSATNRSNEPRRLRLEIKTPARVESALSEMVEVLRLVEAKALETRKSGKLSVTAEKAVHQVLFGGEDFLDALPKPTLERGYHDRIDFGPIRAFAWPRLLQAGGFARLRGGRLVLSDEGAETIGEPSAEALRRLWVGWLERGAPDELRRITGLRDSTWGKAELSPPAMRRKVIAKALTDCAVGDWVSTDAFLDYIRVSGRDFEVSGAPEALRLVDQFEGHRSGLAAFDSAERWNVLQARVVLCLLFEVAATLGLVDVAYSLPLHARGDTQGRYARLEMLSRYDGLHAFRLTELGAFCLGRRRDAPSIAPAASGRLLLGDDLHVQASGRILEADRLQLQTCARSIGPGEWVLDRARTLETLSRGGSLSGLRKLLERHLGAKLPASVRAFLEDCRLRAGSLERVGTARILECRDPSVADAVTADPRTGKHCIRAGETLLVVPLEKERSFYRALRAVGFGAGMVSTREGESD